MAQSVEKDAAQIAAEREIMGRLPGLMYDRKHLRSAGIDPTGVLIPARLNIPYDGDDATDFKATCMGLPVTWSDGEQWGLIVHLPSVTPPETQQADGAS